MDRAGSPQRLDRRCRRRLRARSGTEDRRNSAIFHAFDSSAGPVPAISPRRIAAPVSAVAARRGVRGNPRAIAARAAAGPNLSRPTIASALPLMGAPSKVMIVPPSCTCR
jgi:hypothetical protein